MRYLGYIVVVVLAVALVFILADVSGVLGEPEMALVTAVAEINNVDTRIDQRLRALLVPNSVGLTEGDSITVDTQGRARLIFADRLQVRLMRGSQLEVQKVTVTDQRFVASVIERSGAVLNNLSASDAIDARLTITSEFAEINATGTEFLVVKESHTPLEWIVALDAGPNDLTVKSRQDSTARTLQVGQAVWVAPSGPPGAVFNADMQAVRAWLSAVERGMPVAEIGEVIWDPANARVNPHALPNPLPLEEPFWLGDIQLRLDADGTYALQDCNGDGLQDLRVQNGALQFTINPLQNRVRALDVDVVNYDTALEGRLVGFNPAGRDVGVLGTTFVTRSNGALETLRLQSRLEPFHYADLYLREGCFVGMRLSVPLDMPPTSTPTNVPTSTFTPWPTLPPPSAATSTPTATAVSTATPTPTVTPCVVVVPPGWQQYRVQRGDTFYGLSRLTGASIDEIQRVNCLLDGRLFAGDVIWLPPLPTHTPTPTDMPTVPPPENLQVYLLEPADRAVVNCDVDVHGSAATLAQPSGNVDVSFAWRAAAPEDVARYRLDVVATLADGTQRSGTTELSDTHTTLRIPCGVTAVSWTITALGARGNAGPTAGPARFTLEVPETAVSPPPAPGLE